MHPLLIEALVVLAILQLIFGYLEYRYRPDVIYIAGRLITSRKYLIPSITIPIAYILLRLILDFFFA